MPLLLSAEPEYYTKIYHNILRFTETKILGRRVQIINHSHVQVYFFQHKPKRGQQSHMVMLVEVIATSRSYFVIVIIIIGPFRPQVNIKSCTKFQINSIPVRSYG